MVRLSLEECYRILELPVGASLDQIKRAYRRLALKYHPDRNPPDPVQAQERFKLINEAYSILTEGSPREFASLDQVLRYYDTIMSRLKLHFERLLSSLELGFTAIQEGLDRMMYFSGGFLLNLAGWIRSVFQSKPNLDLSQEWDVLCKAEFHPSLGAYHLWMDLSYEQFQKLDLIIWASLKRGTIGRKLERSSNMIKIIYFGCPYLLLGGWHYALLEFNLDRNIGFLYLKLPRSQLERILEVLKIKYNVPGPELALAR